MWEIEFFETENTNVPVLNFIESVNDIKLKAKLIRELELLEQFGDQLKAPHTKPINDKRGQLYELRVQQSTNIIRIFFFFIKNNRIILTNGFIKKRQKTPKSEINLAYKYKTQYEKRYKL
ncbi:MAG: type II toxin-antitoxin system RelE/ParE family toxin [Candidatus Izemoplasmataceae bacterium]